MPDRVYCTLEDLRVETGQNGFASEAATLRMLRAASDFIDRRLGQFIPVTQTRLFNGNGQTNLFVDPFVALTAVALDEVALSTDDYLPYPLNRHWQNGPYTRLSVGQNATGLSVWTLGRGTVSLTGRWGKYEETVTTGATVQNTTSISSSATALLVNNGALLSPGMALVCESEQMLVEATGAATDSTTNPTEQIDTVTDTFAVGDGTKVSVGEIIKLDSEQMRVQDIIGNQLYVGRGWNSTIKAAHNLSADVYVYRTFTVKRGVNGTTAASHTNGTALSRYLAPPEIGYLALAAAVMRIEKSKAKFAGRQGSPELGETFYYDDFPKREFEQCQKMFRVQTL